MPENVQCYYNTAFKCSKSTTKTLEKCVKYVQGKIIQRKMSGGKEFHGVKFSELGLLSRGELLRGNCLGVIAFGGIIQW